MNLVNLAGVYLLSMGVLSAYLEWRQNGVLSRAWYVASALSVFAFSGLLLAIYFSFSGIIVVAVALIGFQLVIWRFLPVWIRADEKREKGR